MTENWYYLARHTQAVNETDRFMRLDARVRGGTEAEAKAERLRAWEAEAVAEYRDCYSSG